MYRCIPPRFDTFKDLTSAYDVKLKLVCSKISHSPFTLNDR